MMPTNSWGNCREKLITEKGQCREWMFCGKADLSKKNEKKEGDYPIGQRD